MAFPRETEAQIRRTVLDICQEQTRKVLDATRELTNMVFALSEKNPNYKEVEEHLFKITKLKDEAAQQKNLLLVELAESGMLLMNREDFLRLSVQISEIADRCEGGAYRIAYVIKKKIDISEDIRNSLMNMGKNVLKTVTNLREMIFSLAFSRQKALDLAKNVEIAEYVVDELFRETEMKIIDSNMNFSSIILLKDLTQFLEDIADKAEDAKDSTRVLALGV